MCVQKSNGKIRLSLEPTQLNKYIVCPHHNAKLVEDFLPKLSGAKIFSIVDACSSFFYDDTEKESHLPLHLAGTNMSEYQWVLA